MALVNIRAGDNEVEGDSYNMLFGCGWVMAVPRSSCEYDGIGVNSVGFLYVDNSSLMTLAVLN